jgi:hypothetical protein
MSVLIRHSRNTSFKTSKPQTMQVLPDRLFAWWQFPIKFIVKMHESCSLLQQTFRSHDVVMQTDLLTVVVVHFPFVTAVLTTTRLTFVPKLTHAATKHAEICGGSTPSTMTCELLQKHHVGHD